MERNRGHLQTSKQHDSAHSRLFPCRHLKLEDLRYRDRQDNDVVDHVDNTESKIEGVDIDAVPLGSVELVPVVCDRAAAVSHSDPDDDGVGAGKESSHEEGNFERQVVASKDSVVEEED